MIKYNEDFSVDILKMINKKKFINDWISKGGSWYLKIKGLNN